MPQHPFAMTVLLGWPLVIPILFHAFGPRLGAVVGLLAGYLLLPRSLEWMAFGHLRFDRSTVVGLGLAMGVLLDFKALRSARPRWADLAMVLFVAAPFVESALGPAPQAPGAPDQCWFHLFAWGVPYAVGRLYFGDAEGCKLLAVSVVIAGVLYLPLIAFEAVAGPRYYLACWAYGLIAPEAMVGRLGGWRPEVFLNSGIELAHWMALCAVLASWLAVCRGGWRPARLAAPALIAGVLACRGVYGYLILAAGLAVAGLSLAINTPWFLAALLLAYPCYVGARVSGAWDGQALVSAAGRLGNAPTVAVRIQEEDAFRREALASGRGLWLGQGGRYFRWGADNRWVTTLKGGGLIGVGLFFAAFTLPAAWAIFRRPPRSLEFGLALFLVLHVIDGLHNTSLVAPATLIGGALMGRPPIARPDVGRGAEGTARYRVR